MNYSLAIRALTQVEGLGPILIKKLLEYFDYNPKEIWRATDSELLEIKGISLKIIEEMRKINWPEIEKQEMLDKSRGVEAIYYQKENYPKLLANIYDPPAVLYCRGKVIQAQERALAIVGTRHASDYGRSIAYRLASELAAREFVIVSGLARGIDIAAHRGTLSVGGRTIAVLGSGLGHIYPAEHKKIVEQITETGAVCSEYPWDIGPQRHQFPRRNRIISGLSLGVIIVEAGRKSGALITADCALEQGREVFAVPGCIGYKQSEGPHHLIQQGAKLVDKIDDIVEEFSEPAPTELDLEQWSEEQKQIWQLLELAPQHLEMLIYHSGLAPGQLADILLTMEMAGVIKTLPGGRYARSAFRQK